MKRVWLILLMAWLLTLWPGGAWAKWIKIGRAQNSDWMLQDRVLATGDKCKALIVLQVHDKPWKHALGRVWGQRWIMVFCCDKNTFRAWGVTLYSPKGRAFHSIKFPKKVSLKWRTPGRKSVFERIMQRACRPGFGLKSGSSVKK